MTTYQNPTHFDADEPNANVSMAARHEPLKARYLEHPEDAWITDHAETRSGETSLRDPLHGRVHCKDTAIDFAVHKAVGGLSDAPVPGDILCAALASCIESTLCVIANRLDIQLQRLNVRVTGQVDVRGTLRLDDSVPVGFQQFDVDIDIEPEKGTNAVLFDALLGAAETSCVVMQTLRNGVTVNTCVNP